MDIDADLTATGTAKVLVYLRSEVRSSEMPGVAAGFVPAPASVAAALVRSRVETRGPARAGRVYENLGLLLGTVDAQALLALKQHKAVSKVERAPEISLIRPVGAKAASLRRNVTWGIQKLRVPRLWAQGIRGHGVKVGQLDTGVDGNHPCLRSAVADFVTIDNLGTVRKLTEGQKPFDSDGHGTHTAGTIAGRPVRGRHVGVAPDALLCSAAVIEGGDTIARILGGLNWAVGKRCNIISASLGLRGWNEGFLPLTRLLKARGILPVFAIGNEGPGTSRSPGNYSEGLSVGACDSAGLVADYSGSQEFLTPHKRYVPHVVAPGTGVISAKPGGGYQSIDGTSMATPHIAGLAALLWSAEPSATVSDIENAILGSANLLKSDALERQGRGLPDAEKALESLRA